jgi:hypothetical protein
MWMFLFVARSTLVWAVSHLKWQLLGAEKGRNTIDGRSGPPNEAPVHPKIDASDELCLKVFRHLVGCLASWNARSCAKICRFKLFAI